MKLSEVQTDAIREIVNMGTGKAAGILNKMFTTRVRLQVPSIKLVSSHSVSEEFGDRIKEEIASVNLAFQGNFAGTAKLIFPTESATKLVTVFTEEETEEDEMDEVRSATLGEIGNIVLNSLMGTIGNTLELMLSYSIPTYVEDEFENLMKVKSDGVDEYTLLAHTNFSLDELKITGDFILVFEIGSLNEFIALVDEYVQNLEDEV